MDFKGDGGQSRAVIEVHPVPVSPGKGDSNRAFSGVLCAKLQAVSRYGEAIGKLLLPRAELQRIYGLSPDRQAVPRIGKTQQNVVSRPLA